jgi:hypothetical protein
MEWVGVVALIVSAISLGWQVYAWRQRHKPAALVLLRQEYNTGPEVDRNGAPIEGAPPWHTFTIEVRVINRGDVAFEVDDVGLSDPTGSPALWTLDVQGEGRDALVPPGQSLRESFDMAHLPDEWLENGPEIQVVGMATLVSGEVFRSGEPETVDPWPLARVRWPPHAR